MIITDPVMVGFLAPGEYFVYAVEAFFAIGVIIVGKVWLRLRFAPINKQAAHGRQNPSRPEEKE
jgi:hypothetical protein